MINISKLTPLDKLIIIRKCTGITSVQKSLLFVIASRLGKKNRCWPGFSTLMIESSIKNRTSLSENLEILQNAKILIIIPPSDGFKSNRYEINFDLLVRVAYQCSALGVPDKCVTRTRLVRKAYPKRNINKKLNKNKKETFLNSQQKSKAAYKNAREEIRKKCNLK